MLVANLKCANSMKEVNLRLQMVAFEEPCQASAHFVNAKEIVKQPELKKTRILFQKIEQRFFLTRNNFLIQKTNSKIVDDSVFVYGEGT